MQTNAITLRPREAAAILGIGLSSFWLRAKTDPSFPKVFKLAPHTTVVRRADLEEYVARKAAA